MEKKKHYIVYQITNKLNDNIYIGVHVTENINDKYFGSGTNIKKAIKEFGKENFEKIILCNFDNETDMLNEERRLVNDEFIKRGDTYNIILGGSNFNTENTVTVKDKDDNTLKVHKTDPRYLSGTLVHNRTNMVYVVDKDGNGINTIKTDPRYLSGELIGVNKDYIPVKDKYGVISRVHKTNPQYLSGELVHISKDMVTVKDRNDKIFNVHKTDPRYLSGELVYIWKDKKHKPETLLKISEKLKGKYKGEKNSQFGKCWIYNIKLKECKKVKKDEINIWIEQGWLKGRKMNF